MPRPARVAGACLEVDNADEGALKTGGERRLRKLTVQASEPMLLAIPSQGAD